MCSDPPFLLEPSLEHQCLQPIFDLSPSSLTFKWRFAIEHSRTPFSFTINQSKSRYSRDGSKPLSTMSPSLELSCLIGTTTCCRPPKVLFYI